MAGRATTILGTVVVAGLVVAGVLASRAPDERVPDEAVPPAHEEREPARDVLEAEVGPSPRARRAADGGAFVMWARGGFPEEVAARARELPDVVAVAFVRADTLGLVGSRDAQGRPVDDLSDDFRIPVSVTAVDPVAYAATLPPGEARTSIAGLGAGQVLLSGVGAELRRIGSGGEVDLIGRSDLEVAGIVADGTIDTTELLVHEADADALGLPTVGALVVRHTAAAGAPTRDVATGLEELSPDQPARVVEVGAAAGRVFAPLVLSLPELKQRFGEFAYRPRPGVREIDIERSFLDEHIVSERVPLLGVVRCHEGIVDDLRAALTEVEASDDAAWIDPARYGGCHYPRRVSTDGVRLSSHAWGVAVDINVDLALPGGGLVPPDGIIEILGRHGFRWGGDFIEPDHHHWEWVGPGAAVRPTP